MQASSLVVDKAQQLAAAGHHAEVVAFLGARERRELEDSPNLALLYGTAQARLGRHEEGLRWLELALDRARQRSDQTVERRALNARGAAALVSGRIDEAADYFTQALMAASRDGDVAMTGRCSNNLGIISHLRGRFAEALGSWEIAVAAFERAGLRQGVAECYHNLAITYREQGERDRALAQDDRAVAEAEAAGDRTLWALALRGRAESRLAREEPDQARRDLERVREVRSRLLDPVGEAEDLRVAACLQAAEGDLAGAERALREVIGAAVARGRPHLLGEAHRDLAAVLRRAGREAEAQEAARNAKSVFTELGAEGEIRRLASQQWGEEFAVELRRSLQPLHEAQALADAGRYLDLVTHLSNYPRSELEESPMLALLCGIAQARLGRPAEGQKWAQAALSRAQTLGDGTLEVRALNVCGAIALEQGGIDQATRFFARALEEAMQDHDMATVGRCANNIGIIANLRGDYAGAVGAYTRAIAAYEQVRHDRGIAESRHNLGISYREQGLLDEALRAADAAVQEAERLGDPQLKGQALAGRAEIQIARGEPALAIREADRALAIHRELEDVVREAEDLRILAVALGEQGRAPEAKDLLHQVIDCARRHERPLLAATAQRDLAYLLARSGDLAGARALAQVARATFDDLGAKMEIGKLDALFGEAVYLHN